MALHIENNKSYVRNPLPDSTLFRIAEQTSENEISLLKQLSKDLGFSYELYCEIAILSTETADKFLTNVCRAKKVEEVVFLVDKNTQKLGYTLDTSRLPILNYEFLARVISLSETCSDIELKSISYNPDSSISSVIVKRKTPISIEEKFLNKDSEYTEYEVGILLTNDELSGTSARLVIYINGQPLYLPSSYYTSSTARYKKSTSDSVEALEVLMLRVIDDLRDDNLVERIQNLHYRYLENQKVSATYEEYRAVLRTLRRIPEIIENNELLAPLVSPYDTNFEEKYSGIEDQQSSYVWRCTALSDLTIANLLDITTTILNNLVEDSSDYTTIRELLGSYISTPRIVREIAKENM